jgi:hypothetical protein
MAKNIAQISPWEYVDKLWEIEVPGYSGYPGGIVSIRTYLSANTMFGGANRASALLGTLRRIVRTVGYGSYVTDGDAARVFTGQGSIDQFVEVFIFMNENRKLLQKEPALKAYFVADDWIQAMIDGFCFGQDCIGFMGTYLAEAGVEAGYVGRRPLDYASVFKPVQSLDQIEHRSVVMLTNGMHVQIIDEVTSRETGKITVDLCQSSKGGPQKNVSVTISAGGGKYLDVDKFRAALAKWKAAHPGESANEQETLLRQQYTTENYRGLGFGGGAIFQLASNGEPANPVAGSVYVGTMPGGLSVRTR